MGSIPSQGTKNPCRGVTKLESSNYWAGTLWRWWVKWINKTQHLFLEVLKFDNNECWLGRGYIYKQASQVALVVKNPPANAWDLRDMGSIPGLGRSPEGGNGNPLQYSCLGNPMERGAWWATVRRIVKSQTRLSDQVCTHTVIFSKGKIDRDYLGEF